MNMYHEIEQLKKELVIGSTIFVDGREWVVREKYPHVITMVSSGVPYTRSISYSKIILLREKAGRCSQTGSFAEWISKLKGTFNLDDTYIARVVNRSYNTVYMWSRGEGAPHNDVAVRICDHFGFDDDEKAFVVSLLEAYRRSTHKKYKAHHSN